MISRLTYTVNWFEEISLLTTKLYLITDLDKVPKRFFTGLPAQHLFQHIASNTPNATKTQLYQLADNKIRNFFIVANKENVKRILETVT